MGIEREVAKARRRARWARIPALLDWSAYAFRELYFWPPCLSTVYRSKVPNLVRDYDWQRVPVEVSPSPYPLNSYPLMIAYWGKPDRRAARRKAVEASH